MHAAHMDAGDLRNNGGTAALLDNSARRVHVREDCGIRNAASRENCDVRNGTSLRFSQNYDVDIDWIREALTKPGKTQRGLAQALGVDPAAVNRLLAGTRQLKAAEIDKVRAYLDEKSSTVLQKRTLQDDGTVTNVAADAPLKVLGMAEGGPDGWNLWNGDVVQYITRPDNLRGAPGAYAVYITGHSMEPRYNPGEIVHVHPGKPILPGAYVLVQRKPKGHGEPPLAVIKKLVRRSGSKVILHQFNPDKDIEVPAGEIVSMHRIVGSSEP